MWKKKHYLHQWEVDFVKWRSGGRICVLITLQQRYIYGLFCVWVHINDRKLFCPPLDQHRLQEWICSLSGAFTVPGSALPSVCLWIYRCCNKVRSLTGCQIASTCHHTLDPFLWGFDFTMSFHVLIITAACFRSFQEIRKSGRTISHSWGIQSQNPQTVCKYRW